MTSLVYDSCNTMRGVKGGVLVKVGEVGGAWTDWTVGGCSLHHVHNASRHATQDCWLWRNCIEFLSVQISPGGLHSHNGNAGSGGSEIHSLCSYTLATMPTSHPTNCGTKDWQNKDRLHQSVECIAEWFDFCWQKDWGIYPRTEQSRPNPVFFSSEGLLSNMYPTVAPLSDAELHNLAMCAISVSREQGLSQLGEMDLDYHQAVILSSTMKYPYCGWKFEHTNFRGLVTTTTRTAKSIIIGHPCVRMNVIQFLLN